MSWSFEHTGTPAAVAKATTETLDKIAAQYAGKEEAKDVLAVKERLLSMIGALEMGPDNYTDRNAVNVKGSGSHSTSSKGLQSASCQFSVTRMSLKL